MIRLNFVYRKRADISTEKFEDYWRHTLAPQVASFATVLRIKRYVQTNRMATDPFGEGMREERPGLDAPFDGVDSIWWHNPQSLADTLASVDAQAAIRSLLDSVQEVVDLAQSSLFLAMEVPQINPVPENSGLAKPESSYIKGIYLWNRQPQLTHDSAQRYWLMNHGALLRDNSQALRINRYIQCHILDDNNLENTRVEGSLLSTLRQQCAPLSIAHYDGMSEGWFDRISFSAALATPGSEAQTVFGLMLEDEKNFIQWPGSTLWFGKEIVVVDG